MATEQAIRLDAGATHTLNLSIKNPDGTAFNLTGCTRLEFVARRTIADTETVISKTLGSGVAVTSAVAGTAAVTLAAADTLTLSGTYEYDVHLVVSAVRYVALRGKIVFTPAVNRT